MFIDSLCKPVQLRRSSTQSLRPILPDIRHDFIVDVLDDALQIRLQVRRCISQLLLPRPFSLIGRHRHLSRIN
jgi:hypothetical protein